MASKHDGLFHYATEEICRMDIDLEIGQSTIGLLTVGLSTSSIVTMGYIRSKIGAVLGLTQEDFTIKNHMMIVPDYFIAKNYADEIKDLFNGNLLKLDIAEDKQKDVARALQTRIEEDMDVIDVGRTVVMLELGDEKDITLTIYKPCFNLYIEKFL